MSNNIVSRPFRPDPAMACERCVFGTGKHLEQCHATVVKNVQLPWTHAYVTLVLDDRMRRNVIEGITLSDWTPNKR